MHNTNSLKLPMYVVQEDGSLISNLWYLYPEFVYHVLGVAASEGEWDYKYSELNDLLDHPDTPSLEELANIFDQHPIIARQLIILTAGVFPIVTSDLNLIHHIDDIDEDNPFFTYESMDERDIRQELFFKQNQKPAETFNDVLERLRHERIAELSDRTKEEDLVNRTHLIYVLYGMALMGLIFSLVLFIAQ